MKVEYCDQDITDIFVKCLSQTPDQWIKFEIPKFEASYIILTDMSM